MEGKVKEKKKLDKLPPIKNLFTIFPWRSRFSFFRDVKFEADLAKACEKKSLKR